MNIRKAIKSDISAIERIYNIIHDGEEKGITTIGWIRSIYPTRKTAQDALDRDDLFVIEDEDKIVSSAIINHIQYEQYRHASWKHSARDDEVMVLHTLVVDPSQKSKGYGRAFVSFYETYAMEHGCYELRMDTGFNNTRARNLYHRLGYEEVGIIDGIFQGIPDVRLVCLEKHLD